MDRELFPKVLDKVLEKNTIPRILRKNEILDIYRKYYFPEFDQKFKCIDIEKIDDFIFYYLSNEDFQYVLPHPIDYPCYTFTLDKYNIMSRNIINDKHVYRGYQIRWWMHKHNKYKYKNFFKYIDSISDDNIYTISAKLENRRYVDCKFTLKYERIEKEV